MKTAFRFRLYPDRKQERRLLGMVEAARRLWNDALAKSIHDAGWSRLVRLAEYKASRAGEASWPNTLCAPVVPLSSPLSSPSFSFSLPFP